MSGNVWEWTRSEKKAYPYVATDGREDAEVSSEILRVVRGGSSFGDSWLARCAYRYGLEPVLRYDGVGFRVGVVPFSSGL